MDSYLFPTGAIREREKKLFDDNDLERMVDAPSAAESFKIFSELSYADELLEADSPLKYREILEHNLGQVVAYLRLITPERKMLEFLLAPFDYHNLKALFKAKLAGDETPAHLSELGAADPAKLSELVLADNNAAAAPVYLEEAIREAKVGAKKLATPEKIDDFFSRRHFAFLSARAVELDGGLVNLVAMQADLANAKIAVRAKMLDQPAEELIDKLVPGGAIRDHFFSSVYQAEAAELAKTLALRVAGQGMDEALKEYAATGEFWRLEKAFDNLLISKLKEIRMGGHSPAALAAYLLGELNAIKNIQIIMAGKLNNMPAPEIRERLRALY